MLFRLLFFLARDSCQVEVYGNFVDDSRCDHRGLKRESGLQRGSAKTVDQTGYPLSVGEYYIDRLCREKTLFGEPCVRQPMVQVYF